MSKRSSLGTSSAHGVGLGRHLLGLLLVTHPLPSVMYVVVTALLSFVAAAAAQRSVNLLVLAQVLVCVACAQIAIGSLNDYCDRALDAAGDRDKPIVRGLIAPWEAVALAMVASVVVLLTSVPLGPVVFVLALLIEGLGLAYDFRFKGTPISALLFAVYFPLFPLLAWVVFGRWQPFLLWLLPLGAALGVAMNVANTLPDLEADRAAGMRGLPHLLGYRRGLVVAWVTPLLVVAAMWVLHLTGLVPARLPLLALASVGGLLSALVPVILYRRYSLPATLRRTFLIQGLGVIVLAGGWIAAVAF
ncbi:MAG TPA: UbiA family prenyltransferase [Ktedonobacterales bacterium]